MGADFAGFSGTGFLKGVEKVNLTVDGPVARTFNATNIEGVESYNLTGNVNLAQLNSVAAQVNVGARTADATIGLTGNALIGASDTLKLGLTDVGTSSSARTITVNGTSKANALENVAVTATGANNVALAGTDTGVKTVSVSGDGSLGLNLAGIGATGLTSVDATALKGALNLTTGKGVLADNASIKGGASLTDTVTLNADVTSAAYVMSGVEALAFKGAGAAGFSAVNTIGLNTVALAADSSGAKTVTSLGTASMLVELRGTTATDAVSLDHSGTTGISVLGAATGTVANATEVKAGVTLANTSAIELTVAETAKYNGTVSAAKATSAAITVNSTGSANASAVTLADGTKALEQISVTSKGDLEVKATTAGDLASVKAVVVETAGAFKLGQNLDAANTITVSGAGRAEFADLGKSTTAGDQTVSVSGLTATTDKNAFESGDINSKDNATLTVTNVTAAAGNAVYTGSIASQDKAVTVTVNGATATSGNAVDLVDITGATNATVSITNAQATTGKAVYLGNIQATAGNANVTITGASAGATGEAVNIGSVTGGTAANLTVTATGKVGLSGVTATATNAAAALVVTATNGDVSTGDVTSGTGTGAASVKVTATSSNPAHNVTIGDVDAFEGAATVDLSGTKLVANSVATTGVIQIGDIDGKTVTLNLTNVTATKIEGKAGAGAVDIEGDDLVTVNASSLVLSADQALEITAGSKVVNFTGSSTAENKLTATVSETATIVGGANKDQIVVIGESGDGKTATVSINVGNDSVKDIVDLSVTDSATDKLRAVIENFKSSGDQLVVGGLTVGSASAVAAPADLAAATSVITQFLTSAGISASTGISNVWVLGDNTGDDIDYIFQANGATHIIANNNGLANTFDAGDMFITLTGALVLDSAAAVAQVFA